MKVALAYPPLLSEKGVPLLSQNRQFQYFKEPTFIYPVVPAHAATMLKAAWHDVLWMDGIAAQMTYQDFLEAIQKEQPRVIALETKTPVVKQHWRIIADLKRLATADWNPVTVLFGDHVTALPAESMENSSVDYVLTGGDYDFLLVNLCNVLERSQVCLPVEGQMRRVCQRDDFEPGIWYRKDGQIISSGPFQLNHDLSKLAPIDRDLTSWRLYATKNGNFKKTPGTYIMSGRDCWWKQCTFCSWPTLYPVFRTRPVTYVLDEIEALTNKYPIKEIMDDTGTFPVGNWLKEFCQGMIHRGLNRKVILDCNMRFGALQPEEYRLMKKAGFRLLLFGLESANQQTLDRLRKNVKVEAIVESCRSARAAGLFPHITLMFGYPWETYDEALQTLKLGRWLLKKGYAYTVQATIVVPYPGSPLFNDCQSQGNLKTLDWDDYDMKRPVMKSPIPDEKISELVQGAYQVAFDPEFIMNRLFSIRDFSDLVYFQRGMKKVFGHIFDFKKT